MHSSRREFLLTVSTLAATSLIPRRAFGAMRPPRAPRRQFADVPLKATKLRDKVWAITEGGGNSALIATTDGTILIDTKITKVADELRAKSQQVANEAGLAGDAPELVINTHHHFDHIGGNHVFTPGDTTEIIAQRNLKPRLKDTIEQMIRPTVAQQARSLQEAGNAKQAEDLLAWADSLAPDDFAPDREYDDKYGFEHGQVEVILHHFGPGHTDNDTVICFPELNVIHMGDLFFNGTHPFIDRPAGATTIGWQNSVRKAMELCDDRTIVIPGHGEITNKAALPKQIEYFDQLREFVQKEMQAGKSKQTIAAMQPEIFNGLGFEMLLPRALTAMYEEIAEGMH